MFTPPSSTECDAITPYKIALLALVKSYADIADGRHLNHSRIVWLEDEFICKRRLNLSLISWIQQPDGALKSILQVLGSCSRTLHSTLCDSLQNFCDSDSPNMLDDFFEDLSMLIADPSEESLLQRGGILGLFCRRMVLYHEKLSFCQLRPLHDKLTKYCSSLLISKKPLSIRKSFRHDSGDNATDDNDNKSDSFDEMELESQSELDSKSSEESAIGAELKPSDLKTEDKSEDLEVTEVFTSRQADYFFSTQAALITDKETRAMSPAKLQNKISQILKNNPRLTEAHYLSYLNCLRVREFCGSIDCLLTYFNRHAKTSSKKTQGASSDRAASVCRYAALNLALLHYRFGHKKAAIAAAREAVDLSQLASDMQCLQHAMSLMSELDPSNVNLSLIEHQVKPAKQMNLTKLAAKAIQRDGNKLALLGKSPCLIFIQLTASEALARSRAVESLCPTSYVHKGALWRMYGKRRMAALYCQLALTNNWSSRKGFNLFPWQPNTSDTALSLCHLVELLHEAGCCTASQEIFEHVKHRFPTQTEHCKIWLLTEMRLKHKMAIRGFRFSEAVQIEQTILPLDRREAEFRKAERLYFSGDDVKAHSVLQDILKNTSNETDSEIGDIKQCTPEMKCQIYLLLGRVTFNESCDSASSLSYLLKALSTATKYYLHGLIVESKLLIVQLQLYSHMKCHALNTLKSLTHECQTNDTVLNTCRLKLIKAKLEMDLKSKTVDNCDKIIKKVLSAKKGFEVLQDLQRLKDALYFLARLYHEKSIFLSNDKKSTQSSFAEAIANRNKFASEFKQIDLCTFSSSSILI